MIRLINPVLHTKYLDTRKIRSVFLWWTPQSYMDTYKAFLQFETWFANEKGAAAHFNNIWKYPSFHTARHDMETILNQAMWITPRIYMYPSQATTQSTQLIAIAPPSDSAAFAALKGLLPKNPL